MGWGVLKKQCFLTNMQYVLKYLSCPSYTWMSKNVSWATHSNLQTVRNVCWAAHSHLQTVRNVCWAAHSSLQTVRKVCWVTHSSLQTATDVCWATHSGLQTARNICWAFFFFFFSILYFTSIYNVHLKIYNSSINNMFTH